MHQGQHSLKRNSLGFAMLAPAVLLIICVNIYPLLNGIQLSFLDYNVLNPAKTKFIGFGNYLYLLKRPALFSAIGYSALYAFTVMLGGYLIGLALAILLNRRIWGRNLYRTFVLYPWIVPPVIAAICWRWTLSEGGIVNLLLKSCGLLDQSVLFFADPNVVVWTTIMTGIWKSFPFMCLVLLAGLQAIPEDLNEAAAIDGANAWQRFRFVTMPQLKTISFIATNLMLIWMFNNFENVFLLTGGGPASLTTGLSIFSYFTAFTRNKLGLASAIAVIMMLFLSILSLLYQRLMKQNERRA